MRRTTNINFILQTMQGENNRIRNSSSYSPKNLYGQHNEAYKPYLREEFFIDDSLDVWSTEDGTLVASHDDVLRNYRLRSKSKRSSCSVIKSQMPSAVQLELFPGFT